MGYDVGGLIWVLKIKFQGLTVTLTMGEAHTHWCVQVTLVHTKMAKHGLVTVLPGYTVMYCLSTDKNWFNSLLAKIPLVFKEIERMKSFNLRGKTLAIYDILQKCWVI